MDVRPADQTEIDALAELWFQGWRDAHARIVPPALARLRTRESFAERLPRLLPDTRVVGPAGVPVGFCTLRGDELYQLYVAGPCRGTGAAAALMGDAERRLRARGAAVGWLACAIGNDRAARFYEKSGWRRTGTMAYRMDTREGTFTLDVWRYERDLARAD